MNLPSTHPPATVPIDPPRGLAAALREGTSAAHRDAERGNFVHSLIRGQLARSTYLDYLRGLHTIYTALESGLERHAEHPLVGPFLRPELLRAPALARDLAHLAASADAPPAAALTYAEHLRDLAEHDPPLLLAHVYTRYLGDLSGGQLLRRGAARTLGLTDPRPGAAGLEFYDFPRIPDLDAYKRGFRSGLDQLPLRPDQAAMIVHEARRAFADTAALFAALTP